MTILHHKMGWWGRVVRAFGASKVRRDNGDRGRRRPVSLQLEALESRLVPSAVTGTTLASFNTGLLGYIHPSSLVRDASGDLFGTTVLGGKTSGAYPTGAGTIFEVKANSGVVTTLASFNGSNGACPLAGLTMDSSGDLFGTTSLGGAGVSPVTPYGFGTVFEWINSTHTLKTLASFTAVTGAGPDGGVVRDNGGDLFGTTLTGGAANGGTIYEVKAGSGAVTTLASFNPNITGFAPEGSLVRDNSGNLFGVASAGGLHNDGTVFEWINSSHTLKTLAYFNGTNGANPRTTLVRDTSGNFYGTTSSGGANQNGAIFEMTPSGTITTLASFNGGNSNSPEAGVVLDSSGNLFGTSEYKGQYNCGTVFELAKGSSSITVLASFGSSNGISPEAGVVLDNNGDIFGTTNEGGTPGAGTVFELIRAAAAVSDVGNLWAGYVAETNLAQPGTGVTAVSGSWAVPTVTGVPGAHAAVWVGIDGDGNNTVEQVGTDRIIDPTTGKFVYMAWYEMAPAKPVYLFPVNPKDTISASVSYNSASNTFILWIKDTTTGQQSALPPIAAPTGVQRASAEWIVEDPKGVPLAKFTPVTFSNASATIDGRSGPINDPAWQEQQFNIEENGGPATTTTSPLTLGGTGFTIAY